MSPFFSAASLQVVGLFSSNLVRWALPSRISRPDCIRGCFSRARGFLGGGKVRDPVTDLVVTSHDDAAIFALQSMRGGYVKGVAATITVGGGGSVESIQ